MHETVLHRSKSLLADLIAFPTITGTPIMPIAQHIGAYLERHGIAYRLDPNPSGDHANILATIGPEVDGGVMLSGHLDVVPADPVGWSGNPFTMREHDGKLYGRGAVDMKGFVAAAIAAAVEARAMDLKRPLHLAFTFDEETSCFGARQMQPMLEALRYKPAVCLVGEPTGMRPIVAHRSSIEAAFEVRGRAAHAADPSEGVNALYFASKLVQFIADLADRLAAKPRADTPFVPPYTTLNVGVLEAGESRNTVPENAFGLWEVRALPDEDGWALVAEIEAFLRDVLRPEIKALDAKADIALVEVIETRGLKAETDSRA
ncbi:MAG: M20/M25/M40 family metallo-hydrolase, partial [Pseudomonadota bacterium]